jgi:hypothetical protein
MTSAFPLPVSHELLIVTLKKNLLVIFLSFVALMIISFVVPLDYGFKGFIGLHWLLKALVFVFVTGIIKGVKEGWVGLSKKLSVTSSFVLLFYVAWWLPFLVFVAFFFWKAWKYRALYSVIRNMVRF